MTTVANNIDQTALASAAMSARARKHRLMRTMNSSFVTAFAAALLAIFLLPFLYMIFSSLKTHAQMTAVNAPLYPAAPPTFNFTGQNSKTYTFQVDKDGQHYEFTLDMKKYVGKTLDIYYVPLPNGTTRQLALVQGYTKYAVFLDPKNPAADPIVYSGTTYWKSLKRPWYLAPTWSNYPHTWKQANFPRLLWNTFFYAFSTTIGVLISCILVAFGFSRFRFPGRDFWFVVLISTIFLPGTVTVIPTFTFFFKIGWVGTWLPLIVPSFFANAYDTFLLRQFFMTLPRELDESAMIDGASPLRVLWSVIIPQSYAAIVAVTIFHIVWAWNDYFNPLIYLSTHQEMQPISVALARFNYQYGSDPQYIQAGALMTILIPLILFVVAQRFFVQGIVITGVEK